MSPTTAHRSPSGPSPSPQVPAPPSPCAHACGEKRPRPSDDSDNESSHPSTSASHKKRKELISENGEEVCSGEGEVVCSEEERCVAELLVRASKLPVPSNADPEAEKEYESMDELPDDDSVIEIVGEVRPFPSLTLADTTTRLALDVNKSVTGAPASRPSRVFSYCLHGNRRRGAKIRAGI